MRVIREARKTDMPLIRKFTVETGWKSIPETQRRRLDRKKWSKHMAEVFENLSKRESSKIFVAEDESQAFLGYLFVGESGDTMTGENYGFVYDIFVEEKSRGKGIGKILMEKAESYCRKNGYSRISLMVSTYNEPAIRLYTRMGFKREQTYMGKELS